MQTLMISVSDARAIAKNTVHFLNKFQVRSLELFKMSLMQQYCQLPSNMTVLPESICRKCEPGLTECST
jgi:hypothetical protein